jgi:IS30 family transposase
MTAESPALPALLAPPSPDIPPEDVVRGVSARLSVSKADPAPAPDRRSPSAASRRGRPRVLDEAKRLEISALVAGGCSLQEAAKIVGCGLNTIHRELERNSHFSKSIRRSQMRAQLSPLRAMQRAAGKHWRAAAWLLERAYPERFARRDSATQSARQAHSLLNEVINIIRQEINDPYLQARLVKRLKPAFDDSIRAARERRRTSGELRQAIAFFDRRDKPLVVRGCPDLAPET